MIDAAPAGLEEREAELETFATLVTNAAAGRGSVVLIEAAPGLGKTSLLAAFRAHAEDAGLRTLGASAVDMERAFAFGVARQLFGTVEAMWTEAAGEEPLAIFVDDAHWADGGSLRALDALARNVAELPIVLVIAHRPLENLYDAHVSLGAQPPERADSLLYDLDHIPGAILLRLEPLSSAAVARLLGDVEPEFATAAAQATLGNPLLLHELRRGTFAGVAAEAALVRRAIPDSIPRLVQGRLWRLPPACLALARAVAALGDRSSRVCAHELAGLDVAVAVSAHAALAEAGLLEHDALHFTHPLMREATLAGVIPGTRSALHRRAAALLRQAGAPEQEIAAQLLDAEPAGDVWGARVLAGVGRAALAAGDLDVASLLLQRALAEPAAASERAAIRAALGAAATREPARVAVRP